LELAGGKEDDRQCKKDDERSDERREIGIDVLDSDLREDGRKTQNYQEEIGVISFSFNCFINMIALNSSFDFRSDALI